MKFQTEKRYDPGLFDTEPYEVTSVGVAVHTRQLKRGSFPSFLLVEQADVPGNPWGIPAGRTESSETHPTQTAIREVWEEAGLVITASQLVPWILFANDTKETARLVYSAAITEAALDTLGRWQRAHDISVIERNTTEVGRLARVPSTVIFDRKHPIIASNYRWDIMREIKLRLEGLWII